MTREQMPMLIAVAGTLILLTLEKTWPAAKGRARVTRHAGRNLSLGLLNGIVLALLAAPLLIVAAGWAEERNFGLLRLASFPSAVATILGLMLFDGWMYLWHRANHEIGFLWRFHRVHHNDPEMDVTTAMRFHLGEMVISTLLRLMVIPLLGLTIGQLLLYETLLFPVILFHHSNVRFPERLDRRLRALIVTPAIHRIHHSEVRAETDSNYSSVFSFWDRIAGTFRLRPDGRPVDFGLAEYRDDYWQCLRGMMLLPFSGK